MLNFTTGDMFETPADIRVNTVNCVGVMGAGVALAFKNRYPEMFKEYKRECNAERIRPGKLHVWKTLTDDWIINLPTKRHWKQRSRYEDIEIGLVALREYLSTLGNVRVALPALGCGHGGLDWERVSEMIRDHLGDLEAEIVVFAPGDSRSIGKKNADGNLGSTTSVDDTDRYFPSSFSDIGVKTIHYTGSERAWQSDISIVLPRRAAEREEAAAASCLEELANSSAKIAIGMGTAAATRLVALAIAKDAAVVAWVPQGISRYRLPKALMEGFKSGRLTVCSVSSPGQSWNPEAATQCTLAVLLASKASLIVDPAPEWLPRIDRVPYEMMPALFYIRYQNSGNPSLEALGAKPIGRRSADGKPNVEGILDYVSVRSSTEEESQSAARPESDAIASRETGPQDKETPAEGTESTTGSAANSINDSSSAQGSSSTTTGDGERHERNSGVRWSGRITRKNWSPFEDKVLARLATSGSHEITLSVEVKSTDGIDKQTLDDLREILREMGISEELVALKNDDD